MMEMVRNQSQWEGYFLQYLSFIMFVKFLRNYVYCEKPDLTQLFDNVSHQTIKWIKWEKQNQKENVRQQNAPGHHDKIKGKWSIQLDFSNRSN